MLVRDLGYDYLSRSRTPQTQETIPCTVEGMRDSPGAPMMAMRCCLRVEDMRGCLGSAGLQRHGEVDSGHRSASCILHVPALFPLWARSSEEPSPRMTSIAGEEEAERGWTGMHGFAVTVGFTVTLLVSWGTEPHGE